MSVFLLGWLLQRTALLECPITASHPSISALNQGAEMRQQSEIATLDNGITYFGQRQPGSEAKGYGAGGALPESTAKQPYNGITVF